MSKIKALLVSPKMPKLSFWSFRVSMNLLGMGAVMPPLGLITVAGMLSEEQFEIKIIDMNVEALADEHLKWADLVMISAMSVQRESFIEVVRRAKSFQKKIVAGGPYPTIYWEEVAAMGVDHLVLNEAELTLQPFLDDLLNDKARQIYNESNVCNQAVVLTREGKPLLSFSPVPRFNRTLWQKYSSMTIQFSRGCPYGCDFCAVTALLGHIPRTKKPSQITAELDAIYQTGWRGSIFIVDDNFIGNRKKVREFLPVLIKWQIERGYPFSFFTQVSLDLADESMSDIRENMARAGFGEVFVGIESVNPDVLLQMEKRQNRGNISGKIRIIQEAGLEVTGGIIIGSDKEVPSVFADLFDFIKSNGIVIAMVGLLTVLRGTKLYKQLMAQGRIRAESTGNNTHQLALNYKPILDERFLLDGYVALLEELYSPVNYYDRCRALREKLKGRRQRIALTRSNLMAAVKICLINLFQRPSWQFIKYIGGTLLTSPSKFGEAIKQSVKFAHFQSITRAMVRAHRYPKKIESLATRFQRQAAKLHGNAHKCLKRLERLEQRAINRAAKIYYSLDPEFRASAEVYLSSFRDRLRACADVYRARWVATA